MKALLVVSFLLASCGGAQVSAERDGLPSAFAAQFSGTYLGPSDFAALELHRDGTYVAVRAGKVLRGRFSADATRALPLTLAFASPLSEIGTVTGYDGRIEIGSSALTLQRPAASDEELCDQSSGTWLDDDADPQTGLYCLCAADALFIPASGGCVPAAE